MSYFIYSKAFLDFRERQRTPLGRLGSWLSVRATGTAFQYLLDALLHGSILLRLATGILFSLIVGFLIDYSVTVVLGYPVIPVALMTMGLLAGGLSAGGKGSILGALWAWVVGGIIDAASSELMFGPLDRSLDAVLAKHWPSLVPLGDVITWLVTIVGAWGLGLLSTRLVGRLAGRHRFVRRALAGCIAVVVLGCLVILLYEAARLAVDGNLISTLGAWFGDYWRVLATVGIWLTVVAAAVWVFFFSVVTVYIHGMHKRKPLRCWPFKSLPQFLLDMAPAGRFYPEFTLDLEDSFLPIAIWALYFNACSILSLAMWELIDVTWTLVLVNAAVWVVILPSPVIIDWISGIAYRQRAKRQQSGLPQDERDNHRRAAMAELAEKLSYMKVASEKQERLFDIIQKVDQKHPHLESAAFLIMKILASDRHANPASVDRLVQVFIDGSPHFRT